jgi:hypothetical protein
MSQAKVVRRKSDLAVIKAMLARAHVKYRIGASYFWDADSVEHKGLGPVVIVGDGRHTAELSFSTRGKLLSVEGGGY